MNVVAFIIAIVAAVVFFFVPDTYVNNRFAGRTGVAFGLGLLTVALIVQFCAKSHSITF